MFLQVGGFTWPRPWLDKLEMKTNKLCYKMKYHEFCILYLFLMV